MCVACLIHVRVVRYTLMANIMSMTSLWPGANTTRALELARAGIALGYDANSGNQGWSAVHKAAGLALLKQQNWPEAET